MSFYKLSINEVRRETNEAVSILFNVPENLQPLYNFKAGQYITLKLVLDNQEIRRAYSICSSPNSNKLRIAVKAVKDGLFSNFANKSLKENDILEVGLPEGNFTIEPDFTKQKNYCAFAAGSGITPVISIIKSVLESEPQSTFVLVYGNKKIEDTIFYNEIQELKKKYIGRFTVQFVFSQIHFEDSLFGRIDKSAVNFVLNKQNSIKYNKFFLCGPEEMISLVSNVLKENNYTDKNIKFELFNTSLSEKTINTSGHTKVTVLVDGEESTFDMSSKQTLLDALLKKGIDAPYSCQGGVCSSCLCRVKTGSAEMKKNSILTDSEIAEGLVLSCQAIPTSTEIYIDFDDV